MMLNVCETLIVNVKNNLLQNKRSNAELSDKLHEIFEDNVADYDKFNSWYGENKFKKIGGKLKYEHEVIENFKKSVYGELTWFKWFEKEYSDLCFPFSEDAESQELCKLVNVDWQDLDISVIDEFLDNKHTRCLNGDMLTFKDFKLKN